MASTAILIPARYASTRFPGKSLALLDGVPMIKRVYDVCASSGRDTYVLTDDMRIFELFGERQCWIDQQNDYANGTERCAGAATDKNFQKYLGSYTQYINVQGDMPDVTVDMIETVEWHLKNYTITTLCTELSVQAQQDPNSVKVITSADRALWFGRNFLYGKHHLGIYAYKHSVLQFYRDLSVSTEETVEGLEQLRWLKGGHDIGILPTEFSGIEINTPQDAEAWNDLR